MQQRFNRMQTFLHSISSKIRSSIVIRNFAALSLGAKSAILLTGGAVALSVALVASFTLHPAAKQQIAASAIPTATQIQVFTAIPTVAPTFTATPLPTATPRPKPTATPIPKPLPVPSSPPPPPRLCRRHNLQQSYAAVARYNIGLPSRFLPSNCVF